MHFSDVHSQKEYRKLYKKDAAFLPGIQAICSRHNLDPDLLQRQHLTTNVVFQVDRAIIKVFSNLRSQDFIAERAALQSASQLAVPAILAEGQIDNWSYLILSVLDGVQIGDVWDELHVEQKSDVLRQLGKLIGTLHQQRAVPELKDHWSSFIDTRVRGADAFHGLREPWKSWISNRLSQPLPTVDFPVLLHGDINNHHVLLIEENGRWIINGLIDFCAAKIGHPYYDFLVPIAQFTFGQPELTRILLESYGLTLDLATRECISTFCLLHDDFTLSNFFDRHRAPSPEAFHAALWDDGDLAPGRL